MNALRVLLALILAVLLYAAAPITNSPVARQDRAGDAEPATEPLIGRDFVYYKTQPGDTLRGIERKFRISDVRELLELNPDLPPDKLPTGRRLKIPIGAL